MLLFLLYFLIIYTFITRGIPRLLSWFLVIRYHVQINIGRISLFSLSFEDVNIRNSSLTIKIDRIVLTSSLFNQEERKLLTLKLVDVRIEKEHEVTSTRFFGAKKDGGEKEETIEQIFEVASLTESSLEQIIAPISKRVPSSVISLAQFFGLHIINVNLMYLRAKWPECLVHGSAEKIILEGSTVNDNTVALNVSVVDSQIRCLQQLDNISDEKKPKIFESQLPATRDVHQSSDPTLLECNLSLKLYIEIRSEKCAEMNTISVQMISPEVVLQEQLFSFLKDKALVATPVSSQTLKKKRLSNYQLLHMFWLFLPQKFRFKCDGFNIKFVNFTGKTACKASLTSIDLQTHFTRENALENLPTFLPDLSTELQVDDLQLSGLHDTVASINRITLQTQFVGDRINIKIELHTLYGVYDHRDLALWAKFTAFSKIKGKQLTPMKLTAPPGGINNDSSSRILIPYCIGIIFEIWHVSVQASFPNVDREVSAILMLRHSKESLVLTQGMSQIAGEILIESLKVKLGQCTNEKPNVTGNYNGSTSSISNSKHYHTYGTVASIGFCMVEISSESSNCGLLLPVGLEGIVEYVQLEWSRKLLVFITSLARYVKTARDKLQIRPRPQHQKEIVTKILFKCSAINVFWHTDYDVSVMLRIDNITVEKRKLYLKMSLDGSKCTKHVSNGPTYYCCKSSELKDEFLIVDSLEVEDDGNEVHVCTSQKLSLLWSTMLHLTVQTLVHQIQTFVQLNWGSKDLTERSSQKPPKRDLKLQLIARGDLHLGAKLSSKHRVDFIASDFIYLTADGLTSLKTDDLQILFDENQVFHMENAKLSRHLNSIKLRNERKNCSELTLEQNKAWKLVVNHWKVTFPYEFKFAEAFSNDFLSIIKWLKKIHRYKKKEFTADSPLPPDIIIEVEEFIMEVCDDPFEVKLRYNFELMEDEYLESCKRVKALEKKIEETRKTNLQLLSGKINHLFKNLQQMNSEIYIKRSKKMYGKEPIRTQLFLWKMEKVLIFAMADPVFHGTERVVKNMKDIDCYSPWPEEGLEFSTLWCRIISASCTSWKFNLRDYPQPLWDMTHMEVFGKLIGAEQKPTKKAIRSVTIEIESPFECDTVERSLTSLKFYHDLTWEAETFCLAYGPCWEPAVSQFNIALSLINQPARDPSLPLPWWDKMRLLLHGRLTLLVGQMTLLLHASLDPYNTTEEMELSWNEMEMDWTNANLVFNGDLNVLVRTASKYDDVRLLNVTNLKIRMKLSWMCKGDPNDHHSVMRCAPDKLPEYSINQEYDSYRVFRSQNLKMNLGLETKGGSGNAPAAPIEIIFYGSTLRWFENLKFIISGVARPTRRGVYFKSTSPRKPHLSRHYQSIHLALSFQRFEIKYWLSARVKKGFIFTGERLSLSSEHNLALVKVDDGLQHRSRASWSIVYLNTELWEAQIWLITAMPPENPPEETKDKKDKMRESRNSSSASSLNPNSMVKFYFLNVTKVSYNLEPYFPDLPDSNLKNTPTHRLVVHNLRGVWTTSNRDIVFAVYDSWYKSQQMKKNLAPDIIKNFFPVSNSTPQKPRNWNSNDLTGPLSPTSLLQATSNVQNTPSPRSRMQYDHTSAMLQQLIAEADNNNVAYAEDCSTPEPRDLTLQGIKAACTTDDIIHKKWLIQIINSQVLLKGSETRGYVIISAAQSQISQRIHRPSWRDQTLVTKTTWSGSLDCMQYYATVSEGNEDTEMDNIMWLTLDNIEEKDSTVLNEVTDIVGSGQSVGGVVSQTVGVSNPENESLQLQRIVSRCRCEFFYVNYGETGLDPTLMEEVQPQPQEEGLWTTNVEAADTFTLMHYELCASTNYLQYNMVVDILNNLLLYMDPKKKDDSGALARMRFKLQLHSTEDQRKPILQLQNQVRYHLSQLRFLEKEVYLIQRKMDKDPTPGLAAQRADMEAQAAECKEKGTSLGEELAMRIHCYNETQLSANQKLCASKGNKDKSLIRMNEVHFRKAQWRLTDADGQLAIAQVDLSNFLYSKKTFSDDTSEHLLELGFINVRNLLPNQTYEDALSPAEAKPNVPMDRHKTLRIYCREKPPCGGISILEHFEINLVPLRIGLTYQFFKTMLKFCFPYNTTDEDSDVSSKGSSSQKRGSKVSSFYVDLKKDDVEIMKQRAEQNKHFVYIKIPELPVTLSYKGKKEKNLEDAHNYELLVPTMEYHSVTWTWLDLLLAVKMTAKKTLLHQAIKRKVLNIKFRTDDDSTQTEEDKARLLMGTKYMQQQHESKGNKKSLFRFHKNS